LPNDRIALQWDVVRMRASTSVASDDLVETWSHRSRGAQQNARRTEASRIQ
jgi:hypothetical protein